MDVHPKKAQDREIANPVHKYHMLLFSKKFNKVKVRLAQPYDTPFSKRFCLNKTFTDGHVSLQGYPVKGVAKGFELGIDTPAVASLMRSKVLTVRYKYQLMNYCDFPLSLKQENEREEGSTIDITPYGIKELEWLDNRRSHKLQAKIVPILGAGHIQTKNVKEIQRISEADEFLENMEEGQIVGVRGKSLFRKQQKKNQ